MLSREDKERLEEKERIDAWHDRIFAEGREQERADVVAWLRSCRDGTRDTVRYDAARIERGEHVGAASKEKSK